MGTEQLENEDRQGKKRVIIHRPGKPVREIWTDKTFENAPFIRRPKTHRSAPVTFENAPIGYMDRSDLYWIAYQKGFRDGQRKERTSW